MIIEKGGSYKGQKKRGKKSFAIDNRKIYNTSALSFSLSHLFYADYSLGVDAAAQKCICKLQKLEKKSLEGCLHSFSLLYTFL